jgi:hypothetical protein
MQSENVAQASAAASKRMALIALVGCEAFIALLLLVNLVRSDLDPTWHFISEYGIGSMGWLMQLAFLSFAAAHFAMAKMVAPSLSGGLGRFAILLLLIAGLGLLLGGIFKADPMLAAAGEKTTSGMIHNVGGGLGIAMPFAVIFLTLKLRHLEAWGSDSSALLPLAIVAVASSVATIIAFGIYLSASGGVVQPGMPLGIFNRLEIVAYALWFLTVAMGLRRRVQAN